MNEAGQFQAEWEALCQQGLERYDPLQFHYLQALARRSQAHQGATRRLLDDKMARSLAALKARFVQAQASADTPSGPPNQPRLGQMALGALVARLTHGPQADSTSAAPSPGTARPELKALRDHRNTWSKVSVGQELNHALRQAPRNAGPINSHMLSLRALETMRDISPDYLNRFVSYVDTLLVLEQAESAKIQAPKKRISSSRPKSRRPSARPSP